MIRLTHIFDRAAGWEQRVAVGQLFDRLPSDRFSQYAVALNRRAADALKDSHASVTVIPSRWGVNTLAAPRLRRFLNETGVEVIHTWSAAAAVTARAATDRPIILELFDPVSARRDVKIIRTLSESGPLAVAASCQIVRRRLLEGGLAPEHVAVIRPGVDFARINKLRRADLRRRLGVPPDHRIILIPPPISRDGGQFDTALAVNILNHVDRPCRAILGDASREAERILRFEASLPTGHAILSAPRDLSVEALVTASDAVVIAASGDCSTTVLAWAMACETVIVAAAGYAVTELIANKVNGLLFKQTPGRSAVPAIAQRLSDRASAEKVREVARGQAYEIFGLRRYVEDHIRLYDNVLAGRSPAEGIDDPAAVA